MLFEPSQGRESTKRTTCVRRERGVGLARVVPAHNEVGKRERPAGVRTHVHVSEPPIDRYETVDGYETAVTAETIRRG